MFCVVEAVVLDGSAPSATGLHFLTTALLPQRCSQSGRKEQSFDIDGPVAAVVDASSSRPLLIVVMQLRGSLA
jgi:hypothetical protein